MLTNILFIFHDAFSHLQGFNDYRIDGPNVGLYWQMSSSSFLIHFHCNLSWCLSTPFLLLLLMAAVIVQTLVHEVQMMLPAKIGGWCYQLVKLHQCKRKSDKENQWIHGRDEMLFWGGLKIIMLMEIMAPAHCA